MNAILTVFTHCFLFAATILLVGCATNGKPMRFGPGRANGNHNAWYIQGKDNFGRDFSCSFVEFDGQGDFIDRNQFADVRQKLENLGTNNKVLLVFYCHGWKNNSQSGDVTEFNDFLGRLSESALVRQLKCRVHGVYLGWRGNVFKPYVDDEEEAFKITTNKFNGAIVDKNYQRHFGWTFALPEQLTYWSRRNAARDRVSSVPIAQTIYTCASIVKESDRRAKRVKIEESSRVLALGHSFGALLLERALNPTLLDPLLDRWHAPETNSFQNHPLPVDFVLLINSAAPAIFSKTMRDFLTEHHAQMDKNHDVQRQAPVIISLTSSADGATRYFHPLGNLGAPFKKSLRRRYTDLARVKDGRSIRQADFYNRTPGHQPLLVNHWVILEPGAPYVKKSEDQIFNENLDYRAQDPFSFDITHEKNPGNDAESTARQWRLSVTPPKEDRDWANQYGSLDTLPSSYWFVRCDGSIIPDHNNVWSPKAMELYAGLYRLVEWTRLEDNKEKVDELFSKYWKGELVSQSPVQRSPTSGQANK